MLHEAPNITAFMECLYNRAPFDLQPISTAVVARMAARSNFVLDSSIEACAVNAADDFYAAASPEFLRNLVSVASASASRNATAGDAVTYLALGELRRRGIRISPDSVYHRVRAAFAAAPNITVRAHSNHRSTIRYRLSDVIR